VKDSKYTLQQWLGHQKTTIQTRLDTAQRLAEFIKNRLLDFEKVYKASIELKQQYTLSIQYIRLEDQIDQSKRSLAAAFDPITKQQLTSNIKVLSDHLQALAAQIKKDGVTGPPPPTDVWAPLLAPLSDSSITAALTALTQPEQSSPAYGNMPAMPASDLGVNLDPTKIDFMRPVDPQYAMTASLVQQQLTKQQQYAPPQQWYIPPPLPSSPGQANFPAPTLPAPSYATFYQPPLALTDPSIPPNPHATVNVPPPSLAAFEQSIAALGSSVSYTTAQKDALLYPQVTALGSIPVNPDRYGSPLPPSPPKLPLPASVDALSATL